MGDAAQGEPNSHEVFTTPLRVAPKFERWPTPDNYRRYPGGKALPDQIKVWRVQNSGMTYGGVVAHLYGFDDSPDAEILTAGFNGGKESGAVGVGRHGNFLQWGFSGPPSQMTDAGKAFFINCLSYIRQFDGKSPLVFRQSSHRMDCLHLAGLLNEIKDPAWHARIFPADLLGKFKGNPDGLVEYYQERFELIYRDQHFQVDQELQALGTESNRKLATLEKLIALLDDPLKADPARKLLGRYTKESFPDAKSWRAWLAENRDRLFFSDVGGCKFLVVPKGYQERNQ